MKKTSLKVPTMGKGTSTAKSRQSKATCTTKGGSSVNTTMVQKTSISLIKSSAPQRKMLSNSMILGSSASVNSVSTRTGLQ